MSHKASYDPPCLSSLAFRLGSSLSSLNRAHNFAVPFCFRCPLDAFASLILTIRLCVIDPLFFFFRSSQAVGAVTSVDLTMDGMYLLASSRHGPVRTWDVRMGRPLLRYKVRYLVPLGEDVAGE